MIKTATEVNLIQGSEKWKEFRRSKIGASDAPSIMGTGHKSLSDLYAEKVEGKEVFLNAAMKRGMEMESEARIWAEVELQRIFIPKVFQHPFYDWMIASFDGVSPCSNFAIEIKCPGERVHQIALDGQIPSYYKWQLYHQMEVLNLDEIYYVSYRNKEGVITKIKRGTTN